MVANMADDVVRADMAKPNANTYSFPMEDRMWRCMKAHGLQSTTRGDIKPTRTCRRMANASGTWRHMANDIEAFDGA
nr:hypothetical protein CFP56_66408 [Quercus suber]